MTLGFRFCTVLYGGGVRFGFLHSFFLLLGSVRFLTKPGCWFGSFLLGSSSFPSLVSMNDLVMDVLVAIYL